MDPDFGMPFDFFGLGQPANGPVIDLEQDQEHDAWDPWPEVQAQEAQAQEQDLHNVLNLNEQPPPMPVQDNLDLNQPPLDLDLDPVIINLLQPILEGDFLEVNDLQQNEQVQYLLQHEGEVFMLNPQPEPDEQAGLQLNEVFQQNQ